MSSELISVPTSPTWGVNWDNSSSSSSGSLNMSTPINDALDSGNAPPLPAGAISGSKAIGQPHSTQKWKEVLDNYDEADEEVSPTLFTQELQSVEQSSTPEGAIPSPRFGHTAVVYEDSMIVFGGRDGRCSDELWEFKFMKKTWHRIPQPQRSFEKPRARAGHTAVVHKDCMYLFGGVAETTLAIHTCWLNDLWSLNLNTHKWMLQRTKGGSGIPSKRKGHTSVSHGNSMYIFGGGQDDKTLHRDLWEYNYKLKKWIPRRYKGYLPQERMYHVTALYDNKMIVFGGRALTSTGFLNDVFEIDLNSFMCRELITTGSIPSHRMCSTAVCHNGFFAIFTGGSYTYLTDSHQLDLRKMEWTQINKISFGGRTRPTTVRWKNTILTFGGCVEGNGYVNDHIEVTLRPRSLRQCVKQYLLDANIEVNPDETPPNIISFFES
eukprot:TRINITY_DN4421_c0_g1_i1.p1 TRINITY_DN4421_c0_g1~~TRINITY_DN4421_c0_g1_i1.p1  ORF type:complete len:436 (+),score=39.84 TRINITY_DN4421_c0_g1_i1:82-1389(+)